MIDWSTFIKNASIPETNEQEAFKAGQDCSRNGPNTANCHFRFFGSKSLTQAWEQGKKSIERAEK